MDVFRRLARAGTVVATRYDKDSNVGARRREPGRDRNAAGKQPASAVARRLNSLQICVDVAAQAGRKTLIRHAPPLKSRQGAAPALPYRAGLSPTTVQIFTDDDKLALC